MSAAPDLSYLFRRILLPCSAESVFRGGQICLQEFLSEIVVDQVQDRIQIGRIHLPGRGSLSDCAKRLIRPVPAMDMVMIGRSA